MSTYKQPQKVANPTEEPKRMPVIKDWTPIKGVSIGKNEGVKTSGIKMRGAGAATKGVMSRGPMA